MFIDRRRLLIGSGALALIPARARASQAGIEDIVAATEVVGAAGAVVGPEGARGIVRAGRTRARGGRRLFANDQWHIGSNTKAMTAAVYARLVEAGRCRWGATLPESFPDLAVDAAWASVTVEQLMSHTAGLTDAMIDGDWLAARHADASDVRVQRTAVAAALLSRPPAGKPGAYAYGNAGYMLMGAAIERAAGASWEQAMTARLFAPLGMTSAGFGAPPSVGPWGHRTAAEGPVPVDPAGLADNPAVMGPAGRVHLTLGDYARFLAVFLDGGSGGTFLRGDTLARLLTPAAGSTYAGGWSVSDADGQTMLAHEGSNTLWYAAARLFPKRGVGEVAVVNEGGSRGRSAALAILAKLGESDRLRRASQA